MITVEGLTYPTTPAKNVAVGDWVRVYTQPGSVRFYKLGTVTAIRGERYVISACAHFVAGVWLSTTTTHHIYPRVDEPGVELATPEEWDSYWGKPS